MQRLGIGLDRPAIAAHVKVCIAEQIIELVTIDMTKTPVLGLEVTDLLLRVVVALTENHEQQTFLELSAFTGAHVLLELRGEDTHVQLITDPATQLPVHEIGRQHDRIVVDHIGKLLDRPEIDIQFFIVERVLCTPCT